MWQTSELLRGMRAIGPGDAAPPFETTVLNGSTVRVPTTQSWTLISFLRYASCPMCNLRVRELAFRSAELEGQGITWVAVFHSSRRRLEPFVHGEQLRHVIADPARVLYERYGVGQSWWGMLLTMFVPSFYWRFLQATALGYWGGAIDGGFHSMPADFLVSPEGVVRLAHYGRHIGDHVNVAALLNAVRNRA